MVRREGGKEGGGKEGRREEGGGWNSDCLWMKKKHATKEAYPGTTPPELLCINHKRALPVQDAQRCLLSSPMTP